MGSQVRGGRAGGAKKPKTSARACWDDRRWYYPYLEKKPACQISHMIK